MQEDWRKITLISSTIRGILARKPSAFACAYKLQGQGRWGDNGITPL